MLGNDVPYVDREDPNYPDGYPSHLPREHDEPPVDLDKVDISDSWGDHITQRIREVIYRHRRLFRPEQG